MMSGIRARDTKPEVMLRKALFVRGYRYRLCVRDVPGCPDIVLRRLRAAIFVHGCFWHGHDCALFRLPGTRREFWQAKIEGNRQRDSTVRAALLAGGWRVGTVWECALRGRGRLDINTVAESVATWLDGDARELDIRGS
jgi:DNA mismatch endonuclease (patch repair protein)